jgi:ubiquinone/menaquinone biosynthesis C-methylase UbiE
MPDRATETERIRRFYDRTAVTSPPRSQANTRWVCSRAEGNTLEIGIGRGRTLPYYPAGVRLSGIDLSGVAIEVAAARARELGLEVDLRQGDATALPYPNECFDTVAFCFVLCTVPDDGAAVAEAVRVLRPGGRLLILEHVRSPHLAVRVVERLLEPIGVRLCADYLTREPLDHVLAEGLEIEELERGWLGIIERLAARKPGQPRPKRFSASSASSRPIASDAVAAGDGALRT